MVSPQKVKLEAAWFKENIMKKVKKFAAGGMNKMIGVGPNDGGDIMPPYLQSPRPIGGGGRGGGAYGGLETVNQGGRQIGDSLQTIQQGLGGSDGGGRLPTQMPMYKKGGKVSSVSSRADGCAQRGKTKGKMV